MLIVIKIIDRDQKFNGMTGALLSLVHGYGTLCQRFSLNRHLLFIDMLKPF